jgi:predicted  nucleic acid-binding Zn-ribbon protein
MTTDLNDLLVRLDATTEQLRREMRRGETEVDRSTGRMDRSLARVDRRFEKINATARRSMAGILVATGAAAAGAGAKLLQTARDTSILEAQLVTATGSAAAAADQFGRLEAFARETPFTLAEAVEGFAKLTNLGLAPSERAMRSYANTASAMGKTLQDFIEAVADASTAEFERLKEFGIRARNQGDTIRFTFRGVSTEVRNRSDEIVEYLTRIGEVEFANAAKERAETMDGALSNLSEGWNALFRSITRTDVGGAMEDGIRRATSMLEGASRIIDGVREADQALELSQARASLGEAQQRAAELETRLEDATSKLHEMNATLEGGARDRFLSHQRDAVNDLRDQFVQAQREAERLAGLVDAGAAAANPATPAPRPRPAPGISPSVTFSTDDFEAAQTRIRSTVSSVLTETEALQLRIDQLRQDIADGFFRDAPLAADETLGRLQQRLQTLRERDLGAISDEVQEVQGYFENTRTEAEQLEAQMQRVRDLAAQGVFQDAAIDDEQVLERLQTQLDEVNRRADTLANNIRDQFENQIGGAMEEMFARGTISLENFTEAFLRDLARVMARLLIIKPLVDSIGGFFGGFGGGSASAPASTPPGFAVPSVTAAAQGGTFRVGGSGSPDSQYFPMKLSPGELVTVSTVGQQAGMGTEVTIIDQRGSNAPPVDVTRQMVEGREAIRVLVRSEMAAAVGDGSLARGLAATGVPLRRRGR